MTFDEALSSLVAMNGKRVEVNVFDAGDVPHLIASFGGTLKGGYSMTGGEPSDQEAIFVRLTAGPEVASLSLDRELYSAGQMHPDGALTLRFGTVELILASRTEF